MEPILIWTGSKRWHVEAVRNWVAGSRRIVEPFAGSAAVSLGLEATDVWLNDANPFLMEFYRAVREHPSFLDGVPTAISEEDYYVYRDSFNTLVDLGIDGQGAAIELTRARLFYYFNNMAFNHLWRVNRQNHFNVPWRRRPGIKTFDQEHFRAVTKRWVLTRVSYAEVIEQCRESDFIYADPPYDDTFSGYTAERFEWSDQVNLAVLLSTHPGPVVLMNRGTALIMKLYTSLGFYINTVQSGQKWQFATGQNNSVPEVMATNFQVDL